MICDEILEHLSALAPFEYASGWDNVGLLVGRHDREIKKIFVALDATEEIIDRAVDSGADMLLTHHPLIFSPVKRVSDDDFVGRRILTLAQNDISYVAMHTNFDIMGMADAAADELRLSDTEVLEITFEDEIAKSGFGRVGELPREMSLLQLCELVKDTFGIPHVKCFGAGDTIVSRVAILPGSGKSEIGSAIEAGADVYITGDIDHHSGLDALEQGLCVIDAGHYGIEKLFIRYMRDYILRNIKSVGVVCETLREPFTTV